MNVSSMSNEERYCLEKEKEWEIIGDNDNQQTNKPEKERKQVQKNSASL